MMKIHFSIPYNAKDGQSMYITGSISEFSSFGANKALPMSFGNSCWNLDITLNKRRNFEYSYFLTGGLGEIEFEAGPARKSIFNSQSVEEYFIRDEWKSFSDESPFLSTAFKKVLYLDSNSAKNEYGDVIIRLSANNTQNNEEIAICGNMSCLGNWQPEKAVKMHLNEEGFWEIVFGSDDLSGIIEYKFIRLTQEANIVKFLWEQGCNRTLEIPENSTGLSFIINHYSINLSATETRLAGTAIPVFSLRSETDTGIGDFMDLIKMVDFLQMTGQNILQILPVNDTTLTHSWSDSYPYNAISTYALHPIYINLEAAGKISDVKFVKSFFNKARKLNQLEFIDYEAVEKLKWKYLRKLYLQEGVNTLISKDFKSFFRKNKDWLEPYAAFCFLRDKYKTGEFRKWPKYSSFNKVEIKKLTQESGRFYGEIAICYFVQYHLDRQLSQVHDYANRNHVILKGDIPIGINRNSVEAWVEPYLFNFNVQAGAPPDEFSAKGQNWGFPTYNWIKMEEDGYSWWKSRLVKMADHFDAYRIDHILGFFRIWEIPYESLDGLMGHFNPSMPFSKEEIRNYGYQFSYERDCKPFIREKALSDFFAGYKEVIKTIFLDVSGSESFAFKDEYDSQAKIEQYFHENPDSCLLKYKDNLFSLCSDVLFLPDSVDPAKFHPRISAQTTKSYQALDKWQKERFNKLYDTYFYQRNDDLWYHSAMKILPSIISSNGMLVCGEDLGMVPSCVAPVMRSLRILSLEVQRMPKETGNKFAEPSRYPYLSVCTTGTHDTSTIREWWRENSDTSRQFFKEILKEEGNAPEDCEPWICRKILESHLYSPSMLAIFPLQDWISISERLRVKNYKDERINIPSNPNHCWKYRFHLNLEDLVKDEELIREMRTMTVNSGRGQKNN